MSSSMNLGKVEIWETSLDRIVTLREGAKGVLRPSAVLKPSDSSTTAAHTLFSSKKPNDTGPRTCGGLFLSRKPGRQPGLVPSEPDHEAAVGESHPCLRITLNASSPSGKPTGSRTEPFAPSTSIGTAPSSTSWTCFPTPVAQGCTWAIPKAIPRPTSCAG